MRITVVGAGNIGLAMTAYMAVTGKGEICLFTRKNVLEKGPLILSDAEEGREYRTDGFQVTDDPEKAFGDADIVLVTYPAFLRVDFIRQYRGYFRPGTCLVFVPGYGGIEYACRELIDRGVLLYGFQRVPYVARAKATEKGMSAGILSKKKKLFVGAIPSEKGRSISEKIQALLDIPVETLNEYLSITLAPSNPLLHIVGLYHVFRDYRPGMRYDGPMAFYGEWNDEASKMLFAYDAELQAVCAALKPFDMKEVVPLPEYYESPTPEQMTKKLKSIEAFKAVSVPLIRDGDGYMPDFHSRMFVEDYPYGVCVIRDYARIAGVPVPTVDFLLDFYCRVTGHRYFNGDGTYTDEIWDTGVPGIYGIRTVKDAYEFYHK